ncbi:hypothetical protein BT96DRAFT_802862, partial [Gymnopus androsaceus JB14]
FCQIPTFGFDTIRLFANNASEMKRLAARDFEDLLQCAIPVFEGLLPEPHNKWLIKLLYQTAEWHALAKLQMQTDCTLDYMEAVTAKFGNLMRQFRDLSNKTFEMYETNHEMAASEKATAAPGATATPAAKGQRKKILNLLTYKFHALGDYVPTIRLFGPTDVYSTQLV